MHHIPSCITILYFFHFTGSAVGLWWLIGVKSPLSPELGSVFVFSLYAGAAIGSLLASQTLTRYGRHWTLHLYCLPALFGWFFMCAVVRVLTGPIMPAKTLVFGRFLTGLSLGVVIPSSFVYLVELRPIGAGLFGALISLGVVSGSTLAQSVVDCFRVHFIFGNCLFLLGVNLLSCFLPESPKWLAMMDRFQEACDARSWLYKTNTHDSVDHVDTKTDEQQPFVGVNDSQAQSRCFQWAGIPRMSAADRSNMHLAWLLLVLQALTGVGALLFFCESVFTYGGAAWLNLYSVSIGLPQMFFTSVAAVLIRRVPRKQFLHCSTIIMSLAYLLLGLLLQASFQDLKPNAPLLVVPMAVCLVGYSLAWGPLPIAIASELLGTQFLGFTIGIGMTLHWLVSLAVIFLFEPILALVGSFGCFGFMAIVCSTCSICIHYHLPETNDTTSNVQVRAV
ncbi:hypothetical protein AHF37_08757 [Paragonimus kellicotti]|nr:hypothetical protein AHF37_08757 [Paragonimus kellicotti]